MINTGKAPSKDKAPLLVDLMFAAPFQKISFGESEAQKEKALTTGEAQIPPARAHLPDGPHRETTDST